MKICSVHRHGKRGKSTEQRSGSIFSGHGYSPRDGFPRIRGVGRHHLSQVLQRRCRSGAKIVQPNKVRGAPDLLVAT